MSLTPEQKKSVAAWVAAGDNLSAVQKKLQEQFKLSLTYRDVRFLVDDLNLELKDAAPKVDANDVSKTPAPAPAPEAAGKKAPAARPGPAEEPADEDQIAELDDEGEAGEADFAALPEGDSTVAVTVDSVTLIPGALASGTVTFSDGVTGKWLVDQYGRPGFTEVSQPGYRPKPADAQAFMQQLSQALQQRGF
ncbi:MAG: hypothetical protein JNL92_25025 [Opitutaceae bacterium]|nr:hypothetical protein [Opitutaceae bacterium]